MRAGYRETDGGLFLCVGVRSCTPRADGQSGTLGRRAVQEHGGPGVPSVGESALPGPGGIAGVERVRAVGSGRGKAKGLREECFDGVGDATIGAASSGDEGGEEVGVKSDGDLESGHVVSLSAGSFCRRIPERSPERVLAVWI